MFAGGPAPAVAVNVTGFPAMPVPAAVAVRLLGPAAPSVHAPTVAIPFAPVIWDPPVTLPPFPATNVTVTPDTGFPY